MYFVLFNGPPRSGKDTAAIAILHNFMPRYSIIWEKFSFPLKHAFAGMMQKEIDVQGNVDYYEEHKQEIIPSLGVSFRQWQIDFSEKLMKPNYGQGVFAGLLLERVKIEEKKGPWLCLISDCGFQVEVDVLANSYKSDRCLLINIMRDSCSFQGDSRSYVAATGAMAKRYLHNNHSKEAFEATVREIVMEWLHEKEHNA